MEEKTEVFVITEQSLQDKIYTIRGQKVMLDVDLAVIYGYETKNFNRQVKNNSAKFDGDDFMFQLTKNELENLRCKNFTSSWGGSRYLLKNAPTSVAITLFSDNVGNRLHSIEYNDFCSEYPAINITLKKTGGIYHDRFIVLDYGTEDERIFLCGASSKDAGARVTSIVEDFGIAKYKTLIDALLNNPNLILT